MEWNYDEAPRDGTEFYAVLKYRDFDGMITTTDVCEWEEKYKEFSSYRGISVTDDIIVCWFPILELPSAMANES